MKYLKLYESYINIKLDEDDQITLMLKYLKVLNCEKIKYLLDNCFDPDTTINGTSIIYTMSNNDNYDDVDNEILELFINAGLNKNDIYNFLCRYLLNRNYNSRMNIPNILETIRLCVKSGINILDRVVTYDNLFDLIESKRKYNIFFDKKLADKILSIIKDELPEQYNEYMVIKNTEKYNL